MICLVCGEAGVNSGPEEALGPLAGQGRPLRANMHSSLGGHPAGHQTMKRIRHAPQHELKAFQDMHSPSTPETHGVPSYRSEPITAPPHRRNRKAAFSRSVWLRPRLGRARCPSASRTACRRRAFQGRHRALNSRLLLHLARNADEAHITWLHTWRQRLSGTPLGA